MSSILNLQSMKILFISLFGLYILYFFYSGVDVDTHKRILVYLQRRKRPEKQIITVLVAGRLGNIIWEYMALIAVTHLYGRGRLIPATPITMKPTLLRLFERIDTKEITDFPSRILEWDEPNFINISDPVDPESLDASLIIMAKYSSRCKDVLRYGFDNIRRILKFRKELVMKETLYLRTVQNGLNITDSATFIGVHYRGDDYTGALTKHYQHYRGPPDYRYYRMAMDYFRARYDNPLFIFVTIDTEWLRQNGGPLRGPDVYFRPVALDNEESQYEDMVLLSLCNHTIMNYGTYASTTALFAGGETLVYDVGLEDDDRGFTLGTSLAKSLPQWHLCNETACYESFADN